MSSEGKVEAGGGGGGGGGGDGSGGAASDALSVAFAEFVRSKAMSGPIVELDSEDKVKDAVRMLVHSPVLAAPVYNKSEERYIGWVDTRDVAAYIVEVHDSKRAGSRRYGLDLSRSLARSRALEARTVTSLVDLSLRNEFRPVALDTPFISVLTVLSGGLHRIPVVDPATQRVVKVITQGDIISFLASHLSELRGAASRTVGDLGLGSTPVVTISAAAPPLQAFEIMTKRHMSALPVVDATSGQIVTNVSASDIKYMLRHEKFGILESSVLDFVSHVRQDSVTDMAAAVVCTSKDTLGHVIGRLAACKVHRLYVVNESRHPVAVVSLKDILAKLTEISAV